MSDRYAMSYESVGAFITDRQDELGVTDEQIMLDCGLPNERHVKLIRQGLAQMPTLKAYELAEVLESDPAGVLALILIENDRAMLEVIERCMGPTHLQEGEIALLSLLRDVAKGRNPVPVVMGKDLVVMVAMDAAAKRVPIV